MQSESAPLRPPLRVRCTSDAVGSGPVAPFAGEAAQGAQEEAPGAAPEQLLHGRQVPRLLRHLDDLLARTERRAVQGMLDDTVHVDRRQSEVNRGLQFSTQTALRHPYL